MIEFVVIIGLPLISVDGIVGLWVHRWVTRYDEDSPLDVCIDIMQLYVDIIAFSLFIHSWCRYRRWRCEVSTGNVFKTGHDEQGLGLRGLDK